MSNIKIYNIPIQAPEDLATEFIELICLRLGFTIPTTFNAETMLQEDQQFTADEIQQLKLNFVGSIVGKYLLNIALEQKQELIRKQLQDATSSSFTVLPVEIKE